MRITAILHATFLVADLAHSRGFYEEVLGLHIDTQRPDLGFEGIWYDVGLGQQIHLMQLPNPEAGLARPQHGGRDRHIALAIDNVASLSQRLDEVEIPYTMSKSGRRALFCRDPDGNALEFMEQQ